jgi:TonB family protein
MALPARNPERGTHAPVRAPPRVDVFLISTDDAFLIEAGPAFSDRFRTRSIDKLDDLPDPAAGGNWFVVLDTSGQTNAQAIIARLADRIGTRPIIAVLDDGDMTDWKPALAHGTIVDALPRQELPRPRFAAALLKAAERVQTGVAPPPRGPGATGASRQAWTALAAGALAIAVAAGWWLYQRSASTPTPAPGAAAMARVRAPASGAPAPGTAPSVIELLSAARIAFADQKSVLPRGDAEPPGDSALELYGQVLARDPGNDEALDGVARIWTVGRARIQADIAAGKLEEATQLLATFKAAPVDAREIGEVESAIALARPHWLATRAQQSIDAGEFATAEQLLGQLTALGGEASAVLELRRALDARRTDVQLGALARDVKAALDAGALLEPANDNASTRLQAMRQLSRGSTLTLNAQRDVQATLLGAAQQATRRDQFELAQRLIDAATELGASAGTAEAAKALQAEIAASAQRAAAAAAAAAAGAAERSAAPTPPPPPPAEEFINAKPVRPLEVAYPRAADAAGISGYVIVEFTLQRSGRATGARVVAANPVSIFDASALAAVSQGRFDTSHLGNLPTQRARIKVTYASSVAPAGASALNVNPTAAAASAPTPPAPALPAADVIAAKPVAPLDVVYPDQAASRHIQGYVIVEFLLQHDGRATEAYAVESAPAGVFDANALAAVARGRFDTSALTGAQPRRARIKINFKAS